MPILFFLVGALVLVYALFEVVGLFRSWYFSVEETIGAGEEKHETPGQIAIDVGEKAGIGAAEVGAGLAIGEFLGGGVAGSSALGAGGSFGGGGAAGSW